MVDTVTCNNGVRIVHEKMTYVRSVALGVWIEAGTMNEFAEEEGLAHFIEHMLFKGTKKRTARMIAEEFDAIGGDINAFTSKEMTCYFTTVLNNHAEKALEIVADMIFNSQFDEAEIEKEKSVIIEEIRAVEDTADDDVNEQLWSHMYQGHALGKPILGNEKTIATFNKQAIRKFMKRLYRPERIVISVAGNYDDEFIQSIKKYFGTFYPEETIEQVHKTQLPVFHEGVTLKEKDIEQAHISIGFPSLPRKDKRMYDLVILDSLLGGAMSSRLFQEVREERGLAYSVHSFFSTYETSGAFVIYAGTSPEKTLELYKTVEEIIKVLLANGVTEKEVYNAKEQVKGEFLLGLESSESRMHRNGESELLMQTHRTVDEVVTRIDAVTKETIDQVAAHVFSGERAVSLILPKGIIEEANFNI